MATTTTQAAAAATAAAVANESASSASVLARTATITLAANVTANDVYELFHLPKGAVVLGGVVGTKTAIDTHASAATLSFSLGNADNTAQGGSDTDSANSLLPTSATPAVGAAFSYQVVKGVGKTFTAKTKIYLKFIAVAATFAAGDVVVTLYYITPGSATS